VDFRYAAIFGVSTVEKVREKAGAVAKGHPDEDVRVHARRLYTALSKVP
jgi:hypothetical protein